MQSASSSRKGWLGDAWLTDTLLCSLELPNSRHVISYNGIVYAALMLLYIIVRARLYRHGGGDLRRPALQDLLAWLADCGWQWDQVWYVIPR